MSFFSTHLFYRRTRVLAAANALILVVAASAGVAQNAANKNAAKDTRPKAPAKAASGDRTGDVHIRNHPAGRAAYDQAKGIHRLWRDVRVTQDGEDFILYSDELTYHEKTNEAFAKGSPRVETRDSTITATLMRADFDNKVIYLEGNVVMKSHGENDGIAPIAPDANGRRQARSLRGEVLHKPSTLRCNRIDYRYEIQEATLHGDILMRQGDNTGTCLQIVFDEANNIARLIGEVSFTNGDRQTIKARNLTIWIDDNVIETKERVRVDIPRNKKDAAKKPAIKQDLGKAPSIDDALSDVSRRPAPIPPVSIAPEAEEDTAPAPSTEESTDDKSGGSKPEPVADDTSSTPTPRETAKAGDEPKARKTAGG